MKNIFLFFCLIFVATLSVQADSLYRWVDKDGKVHYGDRPADDAVNPEQKRFSAPISAGDDDLSFITRKARQDFPVTLYTADKCGEPCALGRSFLNKRGIPFAEKKLVTQADYDAYKKLTGGNNIPAVTIGKTRLIGFESSQWNSELDVAGYPKTAPYGTRPAKPAPDSVQTESATEIEK